MDKEKEIPYRTDMIMPRISDEEIRRKAAKSILYMSKTCNKCKWLDKCSGMDSSICAESYIRGYMAGYKRHIKDSKQ